jgi:hypothetical protein
VLVAGSFHPSAMALLEALGKYSDGLTLAAVAQAIGARGEIGMRFTSELVARLCAAHYLEEVPNTAGCFRLVATGESSLRPMTEVVSHKLSYLPRSRRLSWHLEADKKYSRLPIKWWKPPDELDIYAPDNIRTGIDTACRDFVTDRRNLFPKSARTFGMEELERDRLLLRHPELIKAEATQISFDGLMVHRCYFSNSAWARVYSAEDPIPNSGYSTYFQTTISNEANFLDKMIASAEVLRA